VFFSGLCRFEWLSLVSFWGVLGVIQGIKDNRVGSFGGRDLVGCWKLFKVSVFSMSGAGG